MKKTFLITTIGSLGLGLTACAEADTTAETDDPAAAEAGEYDSSSGTVAAPAPGAPAGTVAEDDGGTSLSVGPDGARLDVDGDDADVSVDSDGPRLEVETDN